MHAAIPAPFACARCALSPRACRGAAANLRPDRCPSRRFASRTFLGMTRFRELTRPYGRMWCSSIPTNAPCGPMAPHARISRPTSPRCSTHKRAAHSDDPRGDRERSRGTAGGRVVGGNPVRRYAYGLGVFASRSRGGCLSASVGPGDAVGCRRRRARRFDRCIACGRLRFHRGALRRAFAPASWHRSGAARAIG